MESEFLVVGVGGFLLNFERVLVYSTILVMQYVESAGWNYFWLFCILSRFDKWRAPYY